MEKPIRTNEPGVYESNEARPQIRRHPVTAVDLYEVTAAELHDLCRASPSSVYLNLAIGLLSIATSFLISLLTIPIESIRKFTIFVVVVVAGYVASSILLILWLLNKRSVSETVHEIMTRVTPKED
ncbi:MAG: hypothetical protein ACYTEL_21145 [Planctomycetota bacterium]|jgi:hypothetical protein